MVRRWPLVGSALLDKSPAHALQPAAVKHNMFSPTSYFLLPCAPQMNLHALHAQPPPLHPVGAAVAFSRQRENEWMLVAFLGIFMDVLVYHTISLFLKSCAKLLVSSASSPHAR